MPEAPADLDHAPVVVGVGMGFGSADRLELVAPLARLLDAPLCTTRDVTDAGWLPKQLQVGLTGRSIGPKLYVAIGIRGAFEHMVGVPRAGLIVAINKNPRAPIFKQADMASSGTTPRCSRRSTTRSWRLVRLAGDRPHARAEARSG